MKLTVTVSNVYLFYDSFTGLGLGTASLDYKNAKSMAKVKLKCLISYIVVCIGESVIHRLKSNRPIVTAILTVTHGHSHKLFVQQ